MQATVMEVSLDNFLYNVESIKKYVNNKIIIPVIKANAYGTHINTRLDIINMFDIVSVARVNEAVYLRNIGYKYVIVNNKKAKILGNICMDSAMIDVTNIDASINDEVYIWDNINQSLDDVASCSKTINYEIMSTISDRVKRVFICKED